MAVGIAIVGGGIPGTAGPKPDVEAGAEYAVATEDANVAGKIPTPGMASPGGGTAETGGTEEKPDGMEDSLGVT
jgi:hypothetical protein